MRVIDEEIDVNIRLAAAAVLLLLALPAAPPARAADTIRPGKWEYTVTARLPNLPPPPGATAPGNGQLPAGGGMTATHASCLESSDPVAELSKPRGPNAAQSRCRVEKMNRTGNAVSWVTSCTTPDGTSRSEGTAHYTGDLMEADTKTRTTRQNGPPLEVTNHVTGRYLGPCDAR